ncbi:MAG: hypothetical protein H7343_17655, partial [Undibacterium sp.]|nr:hypothetical protein [Opitutaceae bacterium]
MVALERRSPLERAAFLLHDVFCLPFEEIAAALDRTPTAWRQLAPAPTSAPPARASSPPPATANASS